jgi:hypothetical protein
VTIRFVSYSTDSGGRVLGTNPNQNFYYNLRSFDDFSGITDPDNFEAVPDDWIIVVTDVKDSTDAIDAGRYRDVNKIGAASMAVVRRNLKDVEFPFVFGGDGATMVLPPTVIDEAKRQLTGLKALARDQFDLDLRTGAVPVHEVTDHGMRLDVGKLELAAGRCISIFKGGGLSWADETVKDNRERYGFAVSPPANVELEGLSCRWQPIPNERGQILTVLVVAHGDEPNKQYNQVLEEFDRIIDGGLAEANPVNIDDMAYESFWDCVKDEVRYHDSLLNLAFLMRFLEILLAMSIFRLGFNPTSIDDASYMRSLRTHSDYRKFDDTLRLIVDCTEEEISEIEAVLEEMHETGKLSYGLHRSDESLMTCYVDDLNDGGHIHFIDGGNGGYALAAEQLKRQINEESAA